MDAPSEPSTMDASSVSNATDAPSSASLPALPLGSTALSDTESESTTLAVANVIATAPLTLTIVAGVTVIVDIPESRSPAGRKGRRVVEEPRSLIVEAPVVDGEPVIKTSTPSPLEEPPPEIFDGNAALVGDCDTETSIPELQAGGNDGFTRSECSVLVFWVLELGMLGPPALKDETSKLTPSEERSNPTPSEETLGPNETSGNTGPILRSTSISSGGTGGSPLIGVRGAFPVGVGGVLAGVGSGAFLVVGVGGTLLSGAGGLGTITRSGASSVISAPKDTSGSVGVEDSILEVGGERMLEGGCVGVSILEPGGESTLEGGCVDSEGEYEGEGEVDGVDVAVEALGELNFEDEGVDGRDEVDGERDIDVDGDSDNDGNGRDEEGSENPGRSESLLPSPLSTKELVPADSTNLLGFASPSLSSNLLPLPPPLPLSHSHFRSLSHLPLH
ncbi:hypothetical protein EDD22DRAFT_28728 [Suillus occidentalis]|nr:hypothetical protein EDD22DRAFT_28728 [Suillus occidentalis]